ncbi:MAG: ECF-type sigma factor [Planctomycetota bacterium]
MCTTSTESADGHATLFDQVYADLRRLAAQYMRRQDRSHTLQPTALVHEAYLKVAGSDAAFNDREHFLAVAATAMRQILVSHARGKSADKRGGDWQRVTLDGAVAGMREGGVDPLDLDDALTRLAKLSERQARVAELRLYGGLDVTESATALGVSASTIKAEWSVARAWLKRELSK